MRLSVFRRYYWWKTELVRFARALALATHGSKPVLTVRIERRLQGLPETRERPALASGRGDAGRLDSDRRGSDRRDSDRPLRRSTPVRRYFSDGKTRAFFETEIGPEFHFTYHLNQFRLARRNLTYGALVAEWLAERDRRADPAYEAPLAQHGKYNRFVRDFFADERNRGKSLGDAAAAWNAVKLGPGDQRYRRKRSRR